ncbi:MAG TPA: Gfo/Idh/MocA family oxidoreductase, partial [Gaiellaceae bacterium]
MGLRVGLLTTANINRALLETRRGRDDPYAFVAVGSRDLARGEAYARKWGIPRAHGSYEALLADPEVDAVYIALPNAL